MNRRYLNLDSTYRNRNRYPLPAEFEINISQTGTKDRFNATDPVTSSAPIITFNGSFTRTTSNTTTTLTSFPPSGIGYSTNPNQAVMSTGAVGALRTENDFYKGSTITMTFSDGSVVKRVIKDYNFLEPGDSGLFTFSSPLPDTVFSTVTTLTTGVIGNATEANLLDQNPVVFLPIASSFDNIYTDYYLSNYSVSPGNVETIKIKSYNGLTHLAELVSAPLVGNWLPTHSYVLRKHPVRLTGNVVASTTTTVQLPATASTINDVYVGDFIRSAFPLPAPPDYDTIVAPYGETRRVVSYDGTTRIATISPPYSAAPTSLIEVLGFSKDNTVPFNYTGSTVSQQEMVCYEIELINMIIPNRTLRRGGRIAFWPYVWVELKNVSAAGSGVANTIYSNNPNSSKMLFKAPINDTNNPLLVPFVNIDSATMRQTVKFKPNDNLRFSVRFPDGTLFETDDIDTMSPSPPNFLLQISALFSILRI
jgi:hypothetical protein